VDNLVQLLDGLAFTPAEVIKAVEKVTGQLPGTGSAGGTKTPAPSPSAAAPPPSPPPSTDFVAEVLAFANRPVTLWQLAYLLVAGGLLWRIFVKKQRRAAPRLSAIRTSHRRGRW
jgi:hypothetical protein